ncbi:MAG TPA: hypothetical protein VHT97_15550 [Acidimicrobiales bacterium]|jgi:hypothetical protein|nr:hypothetical protein [Acidimicrobiales bacterium]
MPQAAGEGNHRREGVEERDVSDDAVRDPQDQDNPDNGPAMTGAGAEPGGNSMSHWATAMPNADATKPETMPQTGTTPRSNETSNPS